MEQLDRITQQPGVMGGKACIRGMRVTVGQIVGQLATGRSMDAVLADYIPFPHYGVQKGYERNVTSGETNDE